MKYGKFLPENGTIGFVAPSFGCNIEPYKSAFENAQKVWTKEGYSLSLGPNVYEGCGIGISNTPEKCAQEFNECYEKEDVEIMFEDAKILLEHGADGIAFGFLNENGTICEEDTKRMIDLIHSYNKEAVFHRAFDVTPDAFEAIETLIDLGCDRVLTSGQKSKAMEGIDLIKVLNNQYGEKIQILPGSGMNAENAKMMMNYTGVYQVHSSCKNYKADTTTTKNGVSYSYLESPHENDYDVVDVELVTKLVNSIK